MLKEKVAKMMKMAAASMMLTLGVAVAAPVATVHADMLQEVEPNGNPAEATSLPLNTWITGTTERSSDEDWYTIIIPQAGVSQIQIEPTIENVTSSEWSVQVYDADRRWLIGNGYLRTYKFAKIGLAPGKYYVKVYSSRSSGIDATYNLKVNFEISDSWEKEIYYGDKGIVNANDILTNKVYSGSIYCNADVDYYRVRLNGKNNISVRFTIDDTVSNPGEWNINGIEYNSRNALKGYNYLGTNGTINMGQCTGDAIIKISQSSQARYVIGQIYHIQVTATPVVTATPTPTVTPQPTVAPTNPSNNNPTTTVQKPSATKITSIKPGKKQATIRWKKASNATGYYVYRSTKAKGGYKKIATVNGKTTYKDKKALKSKKTYYYKVISYRKNGSKVLKSKASGYKRVKIK